MKNNDYSCKAYHQKRFWAQPLRGTNPKINSPYGFGLDKDGKVVMTDEGGGRLPRFTKDGKYLDEIGNGSGESPGQLTNPEKLGQIQLVIFI